MQEMSSQLWRKHEDFGRLLKESHRTELKSKTLIEETK